MVATSAFCQTMGFIVVGSQVAYIASAKVAAAVGRGSAVRRQADQHTQDQASKQDSDGSGPRHESLASHDDFV